MSDREDSPYCRVCWNDIDIACTDCAKKAERLRLKALVEALPTRAYLGWGTVVVRLSDVLALLEGEQP